MGRRARRIAPGTGRDRQLSLAIEETGAVTPAWDAEEFERRVIESADVSKATAQGRRRDLERMFREAGVDNPLDFLSDVESAIATVQSKPRPEECNDRHRALQLLIELWALPPELVQQCHAALDLLPERVETRRWLLNRQPGGGSRKLMRKRPLFDLRAAQKVVLLIIKNVDKTQWLRDVTLFIVHVWTGLRSDLVCTLRWEQLSEILREEPRTAQVWVRMSRKEHAHGQRYPIIFHRRAVKALQALWRASGRPETGAVFWTALPPHRQLSNDTVSDLMARYLRAAGLGGVDRRRLRFPFLGQLVLDEKLDTYVAAQGFGFRHAKSVIDAINGIKDERAQRRKEEFLTLDETPPDSDLMRPPHGHPVRSRPAEESDQKEE